jgi:DNA ligase D-like protein (predicted polymerase)
VQEKDKVEDHLAIYDLAGLISIVQMGVLEIHIWGSQADQFEKPDRLIFDLDPDPAVDWAHVVTSANEVRLLLAELGLDSFVKTTGGKGLHVVVPIRRRTSWDDAKAFCRGVADFLVRTRSLCRHDEQTRSPRQNLRRLLTERSRGPTGVGRTEFADPIRSLQHPQSASSLVKTEERSLDNGLELC